MLADFQICIKVPLKSLLYADNVGVVICVSGNISRFNDGVVVWGRAKEALEIKYKFSESQNMSDISIFSWLVKSSSFPASVRLSSITPLHCNKHYATCH